jgi:hypothetical protein
VNHDPQRAEIARLKKRSQAFSADLTALETLIDIRDSHSALNKTRFITERVLLTLCQRHAVTWGDAAPTLERMAGALIARRIIPADISPFVRTIQSHTSPGSHYQPRRLSADHVNMATSALVHTLDWYLDLPAPESEMRSDAADGGRGAQADAPPRRARSPWLVGAVIASGVGVVAVVLAVQHFGRQRSLDAIRADIEAGRTDVSRYEAALDASLRLEPSLRGRPDFENLYLRALSEGAVPLTEELFRRAGPPPSNAVQATVLGRIGRSAMAHLAGERKLTAPVRTELLVQVMLADLMAEEYQAALDGHGRFGRELEDERITLLRAVALARLERVDEARRLAQDVLANPPVNLSHTELCCRAFLTLELLASDVPPDRETLEALWKELRKRYDDDVVVGRGRNFLAWVLALCGIELGRFSDAESVLSERLRDRDTGPLGHEAPPVKARLAVAMFGSAATNDDVPLAKVDEAADLVREATSAWPGALSNAASEFSLVLSRHTNRNARGKACAARFFERLTAGQIAPEALDENVHRLAATAVFDWVTRQAWDGFARLFSVARRAPRDSREVGPWERNLWIVAMGICDRPELDAMFPHGMSVLDRAGALRNDAVARFPAPTLEFDVMEKAAAVRHGVPSARPELSVAVDELRNHSEALPTSQRASRDLKRLWTDVIAEGKAALGGQETRAATRKDSR